MSPPPLLAIIGEEAVLICQVTGYETIHWLNCSDNGRLLTSNSSRVTLHNDSLVLRIYPVHRSDSGVFGCIASNRAGSVSVNIVMHTLGELCETTCCQTSLSFPHPLSLSLSLTHSLQTQHI